MMQYCLVFNRPASTIRNVRDIQRMGLNQFIFFGEGQFDQWCAYAGMMGTDGEMYAAMPTDKYYFEIIRLMADAYGVDHVYDDLKHIFEHTGKTVDIAMISEMQRMAFKYGADMDWAFNMFMHVYYGMVAEENKEGTRLGRLIKMNGIHSLLRDNRDIATAADECCGTPWYEIKAECDNRHIYRVS